MNKLTEALSNSSLNYLFKQVYNSAINDMTSQVDSLVNRVDSERASIVSDYSMVKRDYESMQKQIASQTEIIQQLREENANLTAFVELYRSEVEKYRSRYRSLSCIICRVLYDGTDRIDYAYEKNGGRVLTGRKWKWKCDVRIRWTSSPPQSAYFANTAEQADPTIAISVH